MTRWLMRLAVLIGGCVWVVLLPRPLAAAPRAVRCCVRIVLPGMPAPGQCTAVVLHGRRPRRSCRLLGGRRLRPGSGCVCRDS